MIDSMKLIPVRNRNNGTTSYRLPNSKADKTWTTNGQVMNIPYGELYELRNAPGGEYILSNLLIVEDEEALNELNMSVEPEYYMTKEQIRDLLFDTSANTMDKLEDFLNFAPAGAIEIAKEIAVKEQIPDVRKRKLITKMTGFGIDNAININNIMAEDEPVAEEPKVTRKVTPKTVEGTSTPTRKIIIKK